MCGGKEGTMQRRKGMKDNKRRNAEKGRRI